MQSVIYKTVFAALALSLAISACRSKTEPGAATQQGNGSSNNGSTGTSAPVETNAPNSNYKPAFAGQTRIGGVHTQTPLSITVLNSNLQRPWAICNLPDGRFLVTQKGGNMLILNVDGQVNKQISGLPAVVDEGQGGLLDVIIDPQFQNNRMIYWDYAEQSSGGSLLAVAKGRLSNDETKVENIQVIYRAMPAYNGGLQYGSRILFDEDGNLFVSSGDRGANDIRVKAQDLSTATGKILHITTDGKPVAGGPFASTPNAKPEIYAYGFRNPEGMTWNPDTHELWEVEFGPRGGDEVNIIKAGKNYGWPVITYGIEYSGEKVGEGIQQKEGMEQPIYYWDPVISPAGITFYNSDAIPEWKGNLFIGALSGSHICRLVIKDNKVTGEERLLADKGERFRAITQGKDGALYTVTDGGKLYRIGKK